MIYLDNAATTFPKPVSVTRAVEHALKVYGANPGRSGHEMTLKTSEEIYKLPINIQQMNIDYLCMPGHKGLYGPMGTGMLVTTKGNILTPLMEGGTGSVSQQLEQPDFLPDRLESGTINTSGIIGLSAGLDFVKQKGEEKLYYHELSLTQYLYDGIKKIDNAQLYTPRPVSPHFAPVLSFNIKGAASGDIGEALAQQGIAVRAGLHCAPLAHNAFGTMQDGTVRLCPGAFTTRQEIDKVIFQIIKIAKSF